jgi:glycerophosphoryl diester phosphodiesterase
MQPAVMAHRGNSGVAPENTLAAFARAMETKAEWIELDVHLSADGEVVVMHDDTVDRCTNGSGAIAEMTLAEIKALDAGSWFGVEFAGEKVPTLAEVVALVGDRVRINVEIKSAADPMSSLKVVEVLKEGGVLEWSMVSSFGLEALVETRKHWPEGLLALITARAADLDVVIEHRLQWFNVGYWEVDEAVMRRAHGAGVKVMIWTMDDPARWKEFAGMGVDMVCTNVPHRMPV